MAAVETSKEKEARVVKMLDGRTVEFAGKKRMLKTSDPTTLTVRIDWENGETRTFRIPDQLIAQFACHGAEQKLGDEIAGMKNEDGSPADTEDLVYIVDELMERLSGGEWSTKREGGVGGVSVLARAMAELTGKSLDTIKAFLKDRTQKEKVDLRHSPRLKPIIERIESERAAKGTKTDVDALLAEANDLTA